MVNPPKILIVGAGAAGISAACRLLENGIGNVKIYEAETRIGGRIHSVKLGDSFVDLGAQWCHGEKGNIVYDLVKDLDLLSPSLTTYQDNVFYKSSGKTIDGHITRPLQDFYFDFAISEKDIPGSYGEHFIKSYNIKIKELFGQNKEDLADAELMLDFFHKLSLCYDSAPNWQEILANGLYEPCEGHQLLNWKTKGYKQIFDVLMKKHLGDNKAISVETITYLGKEVTNINWQNDMDVTVTCSDGSKESFNHVILTTSLGVLKERFKELFVPALPLYKQNAIEGLSIGVVNKILLKFNRKWWPSDCQGFSLIWNKNDRMNILNEFNLGPVKDGKSWLEDVFGFYVVDSHSDVLLGWMVGELAGKFEEMHDEVIGKGCMYLLKKFLGDKFDISPIEEVMCSRWYTNKNFRGSYSYTSLKQQKFQTTNAELAKPLLGKNNIPRVLFAGEATHSSKFSTVHGAIETGFREADNLLRLYKSDEDNLYKVVIVGAGMAGLGAAKVLIENGITNIVLLEALHQAGGRINTVLLNNSILELGAQWLHSTTVSLYESAKENGFIHSKFSDEGLGVYIRDDGYVFDSLLVKKVDFKIGELLEECEEFVDALEYPSSVGDFVEQKFLAYLNDCDEPEDIKQKKLELFDWNMLFQIIDNSCMDMKEVSSKQWGRYLCLGKDGQSHINIKGGYGGLISHLVQQLPQEIIKLQTPVTNIDYSSEIIKVSSLNGDVYNAEHVIVTSSIGYLKENMKQLFNPRLPKNLEKSIQAMGFCGIGKIFLVFEERWWDVDGYQLIWQRQAQVCKEESWTKYITGFDSVLEQPNVLLAWVGGEGVQQMEALSEELVGKHCVNILRRFLLKNDIPYPTQVLKSNWLTCPYIRGGYSHSTPECDKLGVGPPDLCEPICSNSIPKLLLAGEANHPNFFSTTHGAYESGQDQARRLLPYLK